MSQNPPYFVGMPDEPPAVGDVAARALLALFGDSITTDHISPAGSIKKESPAGSYLIGTSVRPRISTPMARGAAITR